MPIIVVLEAISWNRYQATPNEFLLVPGETINVTVDYCITSRDRLDPQGRFHKKASDPRGSRDPCFRVTTLDQQGTTLIDKCMFSAYVTFFNDGSNKNWKAMFNSNSNSSNGNGNGNVTGNSVGYGGAVGGGSSSMNGVNGGEFEDIEYAEDDDGTLMLPHTTAQHNELAEAEKKKERDARRDARRNARKIANKDRRNGGGGGGGAGGGGGGGEIPKRDSYFSSVTMGGGGSGGNDGWGSGGYSDERTKAARKKSVEKRNRAMLAGRGSGETGRTGTGGSVGGSVETSFVASALRKEHNGGSNNKDSTSNASSGVSSSSSNSNSNSNSNSSNNSSNNNSIATAAAV